MCEDQNVKNDLESILKYTNCTHVPVKHPRHFNNSHLVVKDKNQKLILPKMYKIL